MNTSRIEAMLPSRSVASFSDGLEILTAARGVYAAAGTTEGDTTSTAGHVWYTLSDGTPADTLSYGFAPQIQGSPFGVGKVFTNDNSNYTGSTIQTVTLNLTQTQYNTLAAFGQAGVTDAAGTGSITGANGASFNMYYNVLTNSCIDFTWAALSTIGVQRPNYIPGGELMPSWNAGDFDQAIVNFNLYGPNYTQIQYQYNNSGDVISSVQLNGNGSPIATSTYAYSGNSVIITTQSVSPQGIQTTYISTETLNNTTGAASDNTEGFSSSGSEINDQQINSTTGNAITDSITGTGATATFNNAAISIGANAAAVVAGNADSIAAALGASVSLTAGSTGDTVNVNGTGASVNISGAAVNTDTAIVSGTQEKLGFGGDMVTLAQGGSATVTGTNGTLAAVNDVGGNGVVSNTINLSAGGSSLQQLSGLASYLTEQESDYLGAHLTGTEYDVIDTYNTPISIYSSGSSIETILSGLSGGVANQNVYFSGGNGTGTNYQTNTNFTAGNSAVEFFNPSSSILNQTNDTTGLNGTGTDTFNTINWTLGGSQGQQLTGLGSGITDEESDYLGQSLTGTKHDVIDTFSTPIGGYSTGSSIETVLSGLVNGVANLEEYFSKANATGTNYQTNTNYQAGNSVVVFFNPTTSILTQVDDTTGLNGTGTDTQNTLNWNAANDNWDKGALWLRRAA